MRDVKEMNNDMLKYIISWDILTFHVLRVFGVLYKKNWQKVLSERNICWKGREFQMVYAVHLAVIMSE